MKTEILRVITRSLLLLAISDDKLFYGFNNGSVYPKINYKIINSDNADSKDDLILEINIWTKDSIEADELADRVEDILNYETVNKNGCFPTYYLENRKTVEDDDKNIERQMLTYQIENYYRQEEK